MMPGLVFAVASRGRLDQGIRAKPRDHVAKRKEAPAGASAGGDKLLSQIPHVTV